MTPEDEGWFDSDLYCARCQRVVSQHPLADGFITMRCECLQKAGHREVHPARWWIGKDCQGDERATRLELMLARTTYFD